MDETFFVTGIFSLMCGFDTPLVVAHGTQPPDCFIYLGYS
jgi:hypothetical protein